MDQNDPRYYPGAARRFQTPSNRHDISNPFDVSSEILQDVVARGLEQFRVLQFSLATRSGGSGAPSQGWWQEIKQPGNMIQLLGYDSSTATQSVITSVFMEVAYGPNMPPDDFKGYPLKHNRFLPGPFERIFVRWPDQTAAANTSANLILFRYQGQFPVNGEAAT